MDELDPTPPRLFSLDGVRLLEIPIHVRDDGDLVVLEEGGAVPFGIKRVFVVNGVAGAVRGRHAHKRCTQLLICSNGSVEVDCHDGERSATYMLERRSQALLVPPSIWATETYRSQQSSLLVLCDRPYEADDYLRDHTAFRSWRAAT